MWIFWRNVFFGSPFWEYKDFVLWTLSASTCVRMQELKCHNNSWSLLVTFYSGFWNPLSQHTVFSWTSHLCRKRDAKIGAISDNISDNKKFAKWIPIERLQFSQCIYKFIETTHTYFKDTDTMIISGWERKIWGFLPTLWYTLNPFLF